MFYRVILLILFTFQAQASDHKEFWNMFLTQKHWGDKQQYTLNAFSMPRYTFKTDEFYQHLIGGTFYYTFENKVMLGLGYLQDEDKKFEDKEYRSFIDAWYPVKFDKSHLWLRTILEFRDFNSRVIEDRFRLRLIFRYDHLTADMGLGFHPFVSNEFLFRLKNQNWDNQMGFAQDRLFLGGRTALLKNINLDLALLTIYNQKGSNLDRYVFAPFVGMIHTW